METLTSFLIPTSGPGLTDLYDVPLLRSVMMLAGTVGVLVGIGTALLARRFPRVCLVLSLATAVAVFAVFGYCWSVISRLWITQEYLEFWLSVLALLVGVLRIRHCWPDRFERLAA